MRMFLRELHAASLTWRNADETRNWHLPRPARSGLACSGHRARRRCPAAPRPRPPGTGARSSGITCPRTRTSPCPRRTCPSQTQAGYSGGKLDSTQYALLADRTVWAWGQGTHGQLGNGGRPTRSPGPCGSASQPGWRSRSWPPTLCPSTPRSRWMRTATLGLGYNHYGNCAWHQQHTTPVRLPLASVTTLAGAAACGLRRGRDGVLLRLQLERRPWRRRRAGQHHTGPGCSPERRHVLRLVSAFNNAGALLANGTYWDWGYNAAGQLGDGATTASDVPVRVCAARPGSPGGPGRIGRR